MNKSLIKSAKPGSNLWWLGYAKALKNQKVMSDDEIKAHILKLKSANKKRQLKSFKEYIKEGNEEYWITKWQYNSDGKAWFSNRMQLYGKQTKLGDTGKALSSLNQAKNTLKKHFKTGGYEIVQIIRGNGSNAIVKSINGNKSMPIFNKKT